VAATRFAVAWVMLRAANGSNANAKGSDRANTKTSPPFVSFRKNIDLNQESTEMKKFLVFLCAALLLVGAVACKKQEAESTDTVVTDTVATDTATIQTETTQTTTISAETDTSAQSTTMSTTDTSATTATTTTGTTATTTT
jgi:hypothetical protein